ncbi:putative lipoprotein [Francisella philomiragia]|uniref:type VI secretion system lipoprotein IglE n=1 Tax=Francisella philomiragia TaxID=28110 RepID=UPI0005A57836|nr:type VI secretion system lipoprotein IglE [Francisella philomiragia]AJI56181.1 putative lipoprotein [Francisella philomiragia]
MNTKIKYVFIILLLTMITGCYSTNFDLKINPSESSNNGQPFYVFIKNSSMSNYTNSNIDKVYKEYIKDNSVYNSLLINPKDGIRSISIPKSDEDGVAIYFLFKRTMNINDWKIYVSPKDQKDMMVTVSKNNKLGVL